MFFYEHTGPQFQSHQCEVNRVLWLVFRRSTVCRQESRLLGWITPRGSAVKGLGKHTLWRRPTGCRWPGRTDTHVTGPWRPQTGPASAAAIPRSSDSAYACMCVCVRVSAPYRVVDVREMRAPLSGRGRRYSVGEWPQCDSVWWCSAAGRRQSWQLAVPKCVTRGASGGRECVRPASD